MIILKKILFFLFLLTMTDFAYAQRTVKKGGQIKDLHLHKFEGTWQATTKKDTLVIVFQKHKVHFKDVDFYMDLILGWHKYVHNGLVVENNLNRVGSSLKKSTVNGKTNDNPKSLDLHFIASNRENLLDATFKLIGNSTDKAILKLKFPREMAIIMKGKHKKEGPQIPVPSTWKMTKIK